MPDTTKYIGGIDPYDPNKPNSQKEFIENLQEEAMKKQIIEAILTTCVIRNRGTGERHAAEKIVEILKEHKLI